MLSTITNPRHQFLLQLFTRMIVILIILLLLNGLALLVVVFNGLSVPIYEVLFQFVPTCYCLLFFFLTLGMTLGTLQSKLKGFTAGIACWLILLLIIPTSINFYIFHRSNILPELHQHELDKLKIAMNFEKRSIDLAGVLTLDKIPGDLDKKLILSYFKKEFHEIQGLEDRMREQISGNISLYHTLTIFFPTSHYQAVTAELSSRGYLNFLDYYTFTQEGKKAFFKFYMDKVYFNPDSVSKDNKVENFVKGDENLFRASSRLPDTYVWGNLLTLFYSLLLLLPGYRLFFRSLFSVASEELEGVNPTQDPVYLEHGKLTVCRINPAETSELVFYRLFAPDNLKREDMVFLELYYRGESELELGDGSVLYVSRHTRIPREYRVSDYIKFISALYNRKSVEESDLKFQTLESSDFGKCIGDLDRFQYRELLTLPLLLGSYRLYLIDDLLRGQSSLFSRSLRQHMNRFVGDGACVLYLTSENLSAAPGEELLIMEIPGWNTVKARLEEHEANSLLKKKDHMV